MRKNKIIITDRAVRQAEAALKRINGALISETRKLKTALGLDPDRRVSNEQLFQACDDRHANGTADEDPHHGLARSHAFTALMALLNDREEYSRRLNSFGCHWPGVCEECDFVRRVMHERRTVGKAAA